MIKQWLFVTLIATLLLGGVTLARSGDDYDLSWSTMDGGGYTFSSGGSYSLGATIGQPDAGVMSGGEYTLAGGFWSRGYIYRVLLPILLRLP